MRLVEIARTVDDRLCANGLEEGLIGAAVADCYFGLWQQMLHGFQDFGVCIAQSGRHGRSGVSPCTVVASSYLVNPIFKVCVQGRRGTDIDNDRADTSCFVVRV